MPRWPGCSGRRSAARLWRRCSSRDAWPERGAHACRARAPSRRSASVRPPRILYIEDEPSIAEPFRQALVREGFAPRVAGTALEAMELAAELRPDLVLLDLGLPDADGRDVCRELR